MGKVITGLIIGILLGAAGGWLVSSVTTVSGIRDELAQQEDLNRSITQKLDQAQKEYHNLGEETGDRIAELESLASASESELARTREETKTRAAQAAELSELNKKLEETVQEYKKKCGELEEETAEAEPVDPDTLYRKQVEELLRNVTIVGGPLNGLATKELNLDENQVAGINELLKDEAKRMRARVLEWAAEFIKDKTPEELAQLSDLKLGYALGSHVTEEIEILQKLKPEDRRTIHVKNHFVKFLPKDGKLVKIVRTLHEERLKTYGGLGAFVNEEQEKTLKEKYITNGTFIFPGIGSFGIGTLDPEDLEK